MYANKKEIIIRIIIRYIDRLRYLSSSQLLYTSSLYRRYCRIQYLDNITHFIDLYINRYNKKVFTEKILQQEGGIQCQLIPVLNVKNNKDLSGIGEKIMVTAKDIQNVNHVEQKRDD